MLSYIYDVSGSSLDGAAPLDHHSSRLEISVRERALTVFPYTNANFFHPPTLLL